MKPREWDAHEIADDVYARLDTWLERAGIVEVEVVVGEEPEEGVEVALSDRGCFACDLAEGHGGAHTVWLSRS